MADQKLSNKDLLNVRWANDDPNPKACIKEQEKAKNKLLEAAYDRGIIQELESREQPIRGEGVTAPYPSTDHQYSNHEYWAWYQQTMGTAYNSYDYLQYSGGMTQAEFTGTVTQQIQQAQAQNVYEDCSRLDRIFKTMESKDTANKGNNCPASDRMTDAQESKNRNNNSETKHNLGELEGTCTAGNEDSSASNTHDVCTKDPYRK